MGVRAALAVTWSLLSAAPAPAQEPIPAATVREGTLSFDGHGTGGDFTGTTSTVTGEMTGGAVLAEVRGHVEAPVRSLVTRNDRRDRDMNKSMESEKYPTLRFELDRVSETPDGLVLGGRLTIHGVTKEVELPATLERSGASLRVQSSFPLNLKDYGIKGLSKMLGILKMNENIVVHVDVTFAPGGP